MEKLELKKPEASIAENAVSLYDNEFCNNFNCPCY